MSDDSVIMRICGADGLCPMCLGEDRTGSDGCGSYFQAATRFEPLVKPKSASSTFNPAYRVARCGLLSVHPPHIVEHGPDQPRNCPGRVKNARRGITADALKRCDCTFFADGAEPGDLCDCGHGYDDHAAGGQSCHALLTSAPNPTVVES